MTFLSPFGITPLKPGKGKAPCFLDLSDLSLVVPVKDNKQGILRLLTACLDAFSPGHCPREIILVDNLSSPLLTVPRFASWGLPLQVLVCARPGVATARNLGARTATGKWVLFLDSDCLPTPGLLEGYQHALDGAIAYAGVVRAEKDDPLSRYYETQGIFAPPPVWDQGKERPTYLITANALVWRPALAQVGGFDEQFPDAGGVIQRIFCQEEKVQKDLPEPLDLLISAKNVGKVRHKRVQRAGGQLRGASARCFPVRVTARFGRRVGQWR